ncbi:MAG: FAD binding domain-containing protein [Minwuia sp.]|nr:FAD binding domain-containing protein [Minwuia sp.]
MTAGSSFLTPATIAQAVALLRDLNGTGVALAGATWISRAPVRCETPPQTYVSLAGIPALHDIQVNAEQASIGCLATHARIADALDGCTDLRALAMAAGSSATPAIRRAATIGGNLCTTGFAPADLIPPLLVLDAEIEVQNQEGIAIMPVAAFLAQRGDITPTHLVTRIILPRHARRSAHARLTLRQAGEYPVAHVSVAVATGADDTIADAAVAVGAVEATARRWPELEAALVGERPDPDSIKAIAASRAGDFTGRDATDAPGWYRERVLPGLVARAFTALAERED